MSKESLFTSLILCLVIIFISLSAHNLETKYDKLKDDYNKLVELNETLFRENDNLRSILEHSNYIVEKKGQK